MLSVVSPVFEYAGVVEPLVSQIDKACRSLGIPFEIILVDDGSIDRSWEAISSLCNDYPVKGVGHCQNNGQHQAIYTGLKYAKGDYIIVMDCDLQDDPACIPMMVSKSMESGRSALAYRKTKKNHPYYVLSSRLLNACLTMLTGVKMHYRTGNFGCFPRSVILKVLEMGHRDFYFPVAVRLAEGYVDSIEVNHKERVHEESTYNLRRHIHLAWSAVRFAWLKPTGNDHGDIATICRET